MLGWVSLLVSALGALGSAATPGALLMEVEARRAFVERWEPAHATVTYSPAVHKLADPDLRPRLETHAVLLRGRGGAPVLTGPTGLLARADDVRVEFGDGRATAARVVAPADAADTPLLRLVVEDPAALEDRPALRWADDDAVEDHRRVWLIERPSTRGADVELLAPVLVDTVLGPTVEPPLERLRYAPVRQAEGLPLLDAEGRVLCVVFRQVPGRDDRSLCAPHAAAWSAADPAP